MAASGVSQKLSKFVLGVGDVRTSGERCILDVIYELPVPATSHVVDLVRGRRALVLRKINSSGCEWSGGGLRALEPKVLQYVLDV